MSVADTVQIWHSYELWCRLAAATLIGPLAWEPPYAVGAAPKDKKKKNHGEVGSIEINNGKKKKITVNGNILKLEKMSSQSSYSPSSST